MRAARADKNQPEIVDALRKVGATVQHLHKVGEGCPDILVGFRGRNFLFEIKHGKGQLNEDQKKWHIGWRGDVYVVRKSEDAMLVLQVITEGGGGS
jgi:hypothetical protein